MMAELPLYYLAHSRAGDKGDVSNLSLIAYDSAYFDLLVREVSSQRVADWFADRHPERVHRYVLPNLHAMNFVLEGVLDGGVNGALNLDTHGKSLSFHLLSMPVVVPSHWLSRLQALQPPHQ